MIAGNAWRALHVYLGSPEQFDLFVTEVLVEMAKNGSDEWFFIRYGEGGPHLRIRVRSDLAASFDDVAEFLRGNAERLAALRTDHAWYESVSFPQVGEVRHPPGAVIEMPYEAETTRYGGPYALRINESLFCTSSRLAVHALHRSGQQTTTRARQAVDFILAAAASLFANPAEAGAFFATYALGWKYYFEEHHRLIEDDTIEQTFNTQAVRLRIAALARAGEGESVTNTASMFWVRQLAEACGTFRGIAAQGQLFVPKTGVALKQGEDCTPALANMVGSQMHMMNNRLGFSPVDEMRWCSSLGRLLS